MADENPTPTNWNDEGNLIMQEARRYADLAGGADHAGKRDYDGRRGALADRPDSWPLHWPETAHQGGSLEARRLWDLAYRNQIRRRALELQLQALELEIRETETAAFLAIFPHRRPEEA